MPPFDPLAAQSELFGLEQPGAGRPSPQQQSPEWRQKIMRLIPLVAAAAKGGPGAMEGLLQGYQQAEQQRRQQSQQDAQTQRQGMLDERAFQNQQFNQGLQTQQMDLQRQQLQQKQEADRAGLVQEFSKALTSEDLTDPEAVRALTQLYEARGQALGVRPGTFETTAMQVVKPSTLEKRAAERKVNSLRQQFGVKWTEEGAKFQHVVNGRTVSFGELLAMAGMTPDPSAPQTPTETIEPDTPEKAHLVAFARSRGKTVSQLSEAEIREATKGFRQADDRPPDPTLQAIRELTLAQTRAAGPQLSPAQSAYRNTMADDYMRDSKDYVTRLQAYQSIRAAAQNPSAAGDLALIFSYMRMLDPGSTVREGEFANAQNAAGVPDQIRNAYNRMVSGERLNPRQRADFVRQAQRQFTQAQQRQKGLLKVYTERATRGRINPADVVIDFDDVFGVDTTPINVGGGAAPQNPYRGGRAAAAGR